jgi:hypothetical protein
MQACHERTCCSCNQRDLQSYCCFGEHDAKATAATEFGFQLDDATLQLDGKPGDRQAEARPTPPGRDRALSTRKNRSKILCRCSGAMPGPLSAISMTARPLRRQQRMVTFAPVGL